MKYIDIVLRSDHLGRFISLSTAEWSSAVRDAVFSFTKALPVPRLLLRNTSILCAISRTVILQA